MPIDNKFIHRAVFTHAFLLAYFLCPNLSSFLGVGFLTVLMFQQKPYNFLGQKLSFLQMDTGCVTPDSINRQYNKFLHSDFSKQIFVLVTIYTVMNITWYLPSWVAIIVACELYVFCSLLEEHGVTEQVKKYVQLARDSVNKACSMVPKYQQN